MRISGRALLIVAILGSIAAVAATPTSAVVPPKSCGKMNVDGKRYKIKADQLRCKKARRYARAYLRSHDEPTGYDCEDFGAGTRIEFRCQNGIKVIFAIRR
jgi:hypothetical protein